MGAWGESLTQSDDAYDFLDGIKKVIDFDPYIYIHNEDIQPNKKHIENFRQNKNAIADIASKYNEYSGVEELLYIAFLRFFNIELDEYDKTIFERAYLKELEEINSWSDPMLRESYLNELRNSVLNNKPYSFSGKGLLDTISDRLN